MKGELAGGCLCGAVRYTLREGQALAAARGGLPHAGDAADIGLFGSDLARRRIL